MNARSFLIKATTRHIQFVCVLVLGIAGIGENFSILNLKEKTTTYT